MILLKIILFFLIFWFVLGLIVRVALHIFYKRQVEPLIKQQQDKKQNDIEISPKENFTDAEQTDFEELN